MGVQNVPRAASASNSISGTRALPGSAGISLTLLVHDPQGRVCCARLEVVRGGRAVVAQSLRVSTRLEADDGEVSGADERRSDGGGC